MSLMLSYFDYPSEVLFGGFSEDQYTPPLKWYNSSKDSYYWNISMDGVSYDGINLKSGLN
jgi:hypothetical protein